MKQFSKFSWKHRECWKTWYTKTVMWPVVSWIHEWKEKEVWESFANLIHNFLVNSKDDKKIVERMLTVYEVQGYQMSLKVHSIHLHLEYFPQNLTTTVRSWKVSSRSNDDGKTLLRQNGCKYDGWLLLDSEWDNVHTKSCKRSRRSIKNNKKNIFYD